MADIKLNIVCNFLSSLHFHFQKNWVKECIDYYESIKPNISEDELKREVKQQWLLLNLRDMKVGVFPPNIKTENKIVLNGFYAVQVETLIDSGQSRYSQLQGLRQDSCDNVKVTSKPVENELTNRRCLTMTITDGVQELYAMEYEFISGLKLNNPDLLPGFKAVIKGPVICRKGMLLLGPNNIFVCGGEVDTLVEKNNYELLLLRSLGYDESSISAYLAQNRNKIANNSNSQRMLAENDDVLMDVELLETESRDTIHVTNTEPVRTTGSVFTNDNYLSQNDYEEVFIEDEDDMILNLVDEREFSKPSQTSSKPHCKTIQSTMNQYFISDSLNRNAPKNPSALNPQPFLYLDQIVKIALTQNCVFKIKAIIITLKTKIAVQGDEFSLKAKISDGSLAIDALFASSVLENLLGFCPSELNALMKEKHKNTAISERLRSAFSQAQEKLISLNCLLSIKFFAQREMPCILSMEEITQNDWEALKRRNT